MNFFSEKKFYKFVVVDDDIVDRLTLGHFLKEYAFLKDVASLSNASDALFFIENNNIDILFLDIEMDGMNGLELLERVRDKVGCAIFTTSHTRYGIDAYNANALDYVVKPYNEKAISRSVIKAVNYLDMKFKAGLFDQTFNEDTFIVREGTKNIAVKAYEILYLEALKDYTKLITLNEDRKSVTIHSNLGSLLAKDERFKDYIRVHKSYAVNPKYVKTILTNEVILINDTRIPLGHTFKRNLLIKKL